MHSEIDTLLDAPNAVAHRHAGKNHGGKKSREPVYATGFIPGFAEQNSGLGPP